MKSDPEQVSLNGMVIAILVLLNCIIIRAAFTGNDSTYWWLLLSLPLLFLAMQDTCRKKRAKNGPPARRWRDAAFKDEEALSKKKIDHF